ncbi:hypothetical protein FF38_04659, partial [Lucilia cuprina]
MGNSRDSKPMKKQLTYCCPLKQYYSNETENLVNTLQILPRVIIYKKSLKMNNTYESIINITNKGLYKRLLVYTTDSSDTTVRVYPTELTDNFLQPDQSLQITVSVEPIAKLKINRRRHVFIRSEHPNIIFSIPIIVVCKDDANISLPSSIVFAPTTVNSCTYYEMILYNRSANKLQFNLKCSDLNLIINAKSFNILRKDYGKILLKLYCKDMGIVVDNLKLKFSTGENFDINYTHEPLRCSLFVNYKNINFSSLKFKREEIQKFSICNESLTDIVFYVNFISLEEYKRKSTSLLSTQILEESPLESNENLSPIDKYPFRHFEFKPKCFTIPNNTSFPVQITFRPIMHKDFQPTDYVHSPFNITSALSVSWNDAQKNICLSGKIIGPEIQILPAVLDLRQVYFAEEHCAVIKAVNNDEMCDAHVYLHDVINRETAHIEVTPAEGFILKPYQSNTFKIQFYCTVVGKFMVKLEFKVKNGGIYSMLIKGYSQHIRVKCFPDIVDYGEIPIAIPQKRLVLLMNPLTVPITVQCTVRNDGNETPLILNARNIEEHLPITVNDPFYYAQLSAKAENIDGSVLSELEDLEFKFDCEGPENSVISVRSLMDDNSSCSSEFDKLALDFIPDMSHKFVSNVKNINIFDKPELEKRVLEEALNALLKTPYFSAIEKYKNYTQMDWNTLATDPQEIYCNNEIIRLKPNTGKVIAIIVIPNIVGYQHKYIELRVCPLMQPSTNNALNNSSQIVETEHMISKLWLEYNCSVPEIKWNNEVILQDKIYAGEFYDFQMLFENTSNIGGFFYYDVIPHSNLGIMEFTNSEWKYFIEPGSKLFVPCKVKFNKLGFITLAGLFFTFFLSIKFVGVYACYPFHIKAQVFPPKVNFIPRSISKLVDVLEPIKLYIFIENATPTTTWFQLKLKDDSCMNIEPMGGQLAPTGQIMYVTLNALYKDPGTHKNVLYIASEFASIEKIPITIHVKGIPIFFEPEIRDQHLNIDTILSNTEEDYYADKPNFSKQIKVVNKGLRNYRLSIARIKSSAKPTCSLNSSKAKLTLKPNNLLISPLASNYFNIFINCCENTTVYSEFRIQLTDHSDVKHMETSSFILSTTFIMPQLTWNRREITMNYYRRHKFNEHEQWETIKLRNNTVNRVDCVNLKISGPFKIKELFEHNYENELNFSMASFETKQLFIMLNKNAIRNRLNTYYEGCITCYANSRAQKSVRLKLMVFIPKISIKQNQMTLFVQNVEGATYIELENTGEVPAIYKWKKLNEEWHYIKEDDDTQQVASMILTDLIQMLELENVDPDLDTEPNMTLRYQKYKCVLKPIKDPIEVKDILNEIMENLDLKGRRYKLCYQEDLTTANNPKTNDIHFSLQSIDHTQTDINVVKDIEQFNEETNEELKDHLNSQTIYFNRKFEPTSSAASAIAEEISNENTCVYHTLDHVLDHLKLDDSNVLSLPSSETCDLKNSVYFFDKCGLLQKNQKEMCVLHIPPIRRGFEVRSIFQLDVVGGKSQQLEMIFVNLDKTVTLSKETIYLGLKPWYEQFRTKTYIQNTTNYQVSIKIKQDQKNLNKLPRIALGHINIKVNKMLQLLPFQTTNIRTEGTMGFNEEFKQNLKIIVNENEELILKINGHGIMPILIISKPLLPLAPQDQLEISEEYHLLKKLFYLEIFKSITEKDDDYLKGLNEEGNVLQEIPSFSTDLSEMENSSETAETLINLKREQRFFNLIQTYILVNNNEDLPNSTVLEQLLQTEKFINQLRVNTENCSILNSLYQNYLQHQKNSQDQMRINLKHFTIQSLPFELRTNILDMGKVYLNQYFKFVLKLEFIGPGELGAAVRSVVKIPGLTIDLEVVDKYVTDDLIYYRNDKNTTLCDKPYLNISERQLDAETNPKLKHAHSYDINILQEHQRNIQIKERKCIKNYYNSLNTTIYKDQKHHFTYCKIFTNKTISQTKINVIILFRPQRTHYKHKQNLEDYLYIDVSLKYK